MKRHVTGSERFILVKLTEHSSHCLKSGRLQPKIWSNWTVLQIARIGFWTFDTDQSCEKQIWTGVKTIACENDRTDSVRCTDGESIRPMFAKISRDSKGRYNVEGKLHSRLIAIILQNTIHSRTDSCCPYSLATVYIKELYSLNITSVQEFQDS